ncbi:phage protein GemA/Gp16 family protein [uncultured Pseudoalteromonas sp.]|uniref:phage protein GemA/Gp16 family protein n=1 Tax=uncultured Pseudoalteromonas sp. TaxID=114053 RepID=UPI0026352A88|nr:phage protein GemA/Gp16 family protein [uncultured Pseudoalteromonas sp.]
MSNLIQQIKIAQKAAGIDQDTHQLNVAYISNRRTNTCTGLTKLEQQQLLARYRAMNPNAGKKQLPPQLKMIYSLWGQLHRAGAVNVDSKSACESFCENHLQGKKLYQSAQQWPHIIEVLKQWLARHKAKQGA